MTDRERALLALVEARKAVLDEGAWCVGILAESAGGVACPPSSERAVRWCAIGALKRATQDGYGSARDGRAYLIALEAARVEAERLGYSSVPVANDSGGHQVVLEMFGSAISRLG